MPAEFCLHTSSAKPEHLGQLFTAPHDCRDSCHEPRIVDRRIEIWTATCQHDLVRSAACKPSSRTYGRKQQSPRRLGSQHRGQYCLPENRSKLRKHLDPVGHLTPDLADRPLQGVRLVWASDSPWKTWLQPESAGRESRKKMKHTV